MTKKDEQITAYEAAIKLYSHEGDIIWSRFNAMLVANSILLLAIIQIFGFTDVPINKTFLILPLSFSGIILNFFWICIMQRGHDFHEYWRRCAQEIEQNKLKGITIFNDRGFKFKNNIEVEFKLDEPGERVHKMHFFSRIIKINSISPIVGIVFIIAYLIFLPMLYFL